ncbi:hypothetical protein EVAR_90889_1 [Eumeta japonica]|uniref:Uncharacterized protein n=1 Tax=Eumeta variegata TaxID=151549 RepID=A0A4C1ZVC6_EUMVA|nr:hypothetical protein EVAR_90889_1 [Eumeta japonica]
MKSVLASNGVLMHLDPSDHDYLTIVCGRRRAYATRRGEGRAPPKNAQIHKKIGTAIIFRVCGFNQFYTADRGLSFSLGSHRMGTTVSDPRVRKIRLIIYPRAAPPGGDAGGGGEAGGGRLAAYVNFLAEELRVMLDSLKKESSSYGVLKKVIIKF